MEARVTVDPKYWPLHSELAWVLTRDRVLCQRIQSSDFYPVLDKSDWVDEVDRAWSILRQSLVDGSVPAFKVSVLCGNEESVAPEAIASLNWADLTKDEYGLIVVCSTVMNRVFPSGSDPVAFMSDHIGPPVRPGGPGFMTLSDAAYWIATEGGTKRIVARDVSVWKGAFDELLSRIQSNDVQVVGRRHGLGIAEVIEGTKFAGVAVEYPYSEPSIKLMLNG